MFRYLFSLVVAGIALVIAIMLIALFGDAARKYHWVFLFLWAYLPAFSFWLGASATAERMEISSLKGIRVALMVSAFFLAYPGFNGLDYVTMHIADWLGYKVATVRDFDSQGGVVFHHVVQSDSTLADLGFVILRVMWLILCVLEPFLTWFGLSRTITKRMRGDSQTQSPTVDTRRLGSGPARTAATASRGLPSFPPSPTGAFSSLPATRSSTTSTTGAAPPAPSRPTRASASIERLLTPIVDPIGAVSNPGLRNAKWANMPSEAGLKSLDNSDKESSTQEASAKKGLTVRQSLEFVRSLSPEQIKRLSDPRYVRSIAVRPQFKEGYPKQGAQSADEEPSGANPPNKGKRDDGKSE